MKTIFYNSAVAKQCGKNGIIKAVLLNYIYNYHKQNIRKGAGHPASISLGEFVDQYIYEDLCLWKRSFIHKILKDLEKDKHLHIAKDEYRRPVYSVSEEIRTLLCAEDATWVGFELEMACKFGIYIAIVSRFLLHVIAQSPGGVAYNLSVKEMAELNCISPAEIYRIIAGLVKGQVVMRMRSPLKHPAHGLHLARWKCENANA